MWHIIEFVAGKDILEILAILQMEREVACSKYSETVKNGHCT